MSQPYGLDDMHYGRISGNGISSETNRNTIGSMLGNATIRRIIDRKLRLCLRVSLAG